MKKALWFIAAVIALGCVGQFLTVRAAANPPALGGTGTVTVPLPGQVLIGNGSNTYTPAYILCAGTCSVATSSGGITITGTGVSTTTGNWQGTWQLYRPTDFLASSTQVVNTVNGGSGTVTITSSTLGVVWPTINGNKSATYQIVAGTGATSTVSGATTTISVSLNNGVTQTCSANQFVNSVTGAGIASCGTITFPTIPTYTFSAGSGISLSQATSSSNTTTTITNTGVTSFVGAGCATAANSSGSVQLTVTCISGNQSITFTIGGDASGTASGTTAITDNITVTGLDGKTLPSLATGTLTYSMGVWSINLATSSLGIYDGNGKLSSYLGSACGGGLYVTGFSATGTVSCATPPGGVTSFNTATGTVMYNVNAGSGLSVTTSTTSSTLTLNINGGSVQNCTNQVVTGLSSQGLITCSATVNSISGVSTGTITLIAGTGVTITTSTNSITINSTASGGGVSTSTSNTWSGTQSFGSSTVVNLNGLVWVPANFASGGCSTYTATSTFDACVTAIYNSFASSTWDAIVLPPMTVPQSQWLNGINFNRNGVSVNFISLGGTTLAYGGTGSAITVNTQNPIGHPQTQIGGFNMQGQATLIAAGNANTATTTGITCGGTNGCVGVPFYSMSINGFGIQTHQTSNAYLNTYQNISLSGGNGLTNGNCFLMDLASNSGERTVLDGVNCTDPGDTTTTAQSVYLTGGAAASTFVQNLSLDDAALYDGFSNGLLGIDRIHVEDSDCGQYGAYIPFYATSSAASMVSIEQLEIANDCSGSNGFQTIIKHGVELSIQAWHDDNYGGGTIPLLVDHSLNNGTESEHICDGSVSGGSVTNIVSNQAYSQAVAIGCVQDTDNSYPLSIYIDGSNIIHIRNGNQDVATGDSLGNWTFGGAAGTVTASHGLISGSTLSVSTNATVGGNINSTGTISQSGVPDLTQGNVSGTSGTIPLFSGPHTVGNSSLSQSGGTTLINGATPVLDGAGDYIGPNIYMSTTSTVSVGNFVQGGGVETFNASTSVTGSQFCAGGLINIQGTTGNAIITLPNIATLSSSTLTPCATSIWSGSFAQQYMVNNSTNTVSSATNGANEVQMYAPGTPTVLQPGQEWFITGQFENSSTVSGANATGTILVVKYLLEQSSTPLVVSGNTVTYNGTALSTSTPSSLAGAYLSPTGSQLTVSSTLASSTWTLNIQSATTTASTTNYASVRSSQTRTIYWFGCYDSTGTTTLNLFVPKSFATTTVSSTINGSFACGINGNSSTVSSTLAAGSYVDVEVSSTAGTPVATFLYIDTTKQ